MPVFWLVVAVPLATATVPAVEIRAASLTAIPPPLTRAASDGGQPEQPGDVRGREDGDAALPVGAERPGTPGDRSAGSNWESVTARSTVQPGLTTVTNGAGAVGFLGS